MATLTAAAAASASIARLAEVDKQQPKWQYQRRHRGRRRQQQQQQQQQQRSSGVCQADKKASGGKQMVWKQGKLEAEDIDYQELNELLEDGLDWDVEEQLRFSEEVQPEEPDDLWDSFDASEQAAIAHILDMSGITQTGSAAGAKSAAAAAQVSTSATAAGAAAAAANANALDDQAEMLGQEQQQQSPSAEEIERMGDEFLRRLDLEETAISSSSSSPPPPLPPSFLDSKVDFEPKPSSKIREAIQLSKMDFTVNSLLDKVKRNKLDLRPSYQREYVWTARNASKLIESLLLNVPIPTLFFNETEDGRLEVVDGKQRLTSIYSFVSGKFPNGQTFDLSGLEVLPHLNGKTFTSLTEDEREKLLDYPLNIHTLSRHNDSDYVFEVFERLNMGATQLNEMELRNCIYHGTYNFILHKLASTPQMMQIMQSDSLHARMKDRELILRFFAILRASPEGFKNPMKKFLNEEIRQHRDLSSEEMEQMCKVFIRAAECTLQTVGPAGFRIKNSNEINPGLFEMLLYCFAPYEPDDVKLYASEIEENLNSFIKENGKSLLVASPRAVSKRIRLWGQTLDSILNAVPEEAAEDSSDGGDKDESGGSDGSQGVKKRGLGLFGL